MHEDFCTVEQNIEPWPKQIAQGRQKEERYYS